MRFRVGRQLASTGTAHRWWSIATGIAGAILLMLTACIAIAAVRSDLASGFWKFIGGPGSELSVVLVVVSMAVLGLGYLQIRNLQLRNTAFAVTAGLACFSGVLGLASYWPCSAEQSVVLTPLARTLALFVGSVDDPFSAGSGTCEVFPLSLEIARITALLATFVGIGALALSVLRNQWDRMCLKLVRLTPAPTVVVGVDDEVLPLIRAIQDARIGRPLVIVTSDASRDGLAVMRRRGARIVEVDLNDDGSLTSLTFWGGMERLYLLSEDPVRNAQRLRLIDKEIATFEASIPTDERKIRKQLTCRVDDPLLAEYWRHNPIRNSNNKRWIVDTVGTYDVTASRIADALQEYKCIDHVYICGETPLFLALVEQLTRRRLEYDFMPDPDTSSIQQVTSICPDAGVLVEDNRLRQRRRGVNDSPILVDAIEKVPTMSILDHVVRSEANHSRVAIIVADAHDETCGSIGRAEHLANRLAARFPHVVVFGPSTGVDGVSEMELLGNLRLFGLSLTLPEGTAHDAWERAARLIHERYAAQEKARNPERASDQTLAPWEQLDPFVQGSNRRLVENMIRIVEKDGGHTWFHPEGFEGNNTETSIDLWGMPPLQALEMLGFSTEQSKRLAACEHQDWKEYLVKHGWEFAETRDTAAQKHDLLMPWNTLTDEQREKAYRSVLTTLLHLRALGYRSRPKNDEYRVRSAT